jgi:xanthine dehydrogenase YagT iron-sulfur-binding subunit
MSLATLAKAFDDKECGRHVDTEHQYARGAMGCYLMSPRRPFCQSEKVNIMSIEVNGSTAELPTDARVSLLDFLRDHLQLYGSKKGCDQGACGACTVLVDGERMLSCLALAVQCEGRKITTVEGLADGNALHALQQAFIDHDGFQCGYCTPGQICSAIGMAKEAKRGVPSYVSADLAADVTLTREELQERMSGNLCRCGAHNGIIDAIRETMAAEMAE